MIKRKKILFVIENFFPDISATGNCTYNVAKYFNEQGWEVSVLAKKKHKDWETNQNYNGIKIKRIMPSFYDLKSNCFLINIINKIIYFFISIIYLPIWPLKSKKIVKKYAHEVVDMDIKEKFNYIVYVVNPPFSLEINYYIHKKMKYNSGGKKIVYYLDMLMGECNNKYLPKKFSKWKVYNLEKKCLPFFDMFFLINSHKNVYNSKKYNFLDNKYYVDLPALNIEMINQKCRTNKKSESKVIRIVYAGTLDKKRNPFIISDFFKKVSHEFNQKIELNFYGKNDCKGNINYSDDNISIHHLGLINRDELFNVYNESDFLLNIDNENQGMIPSKIYEFISMGKAIINMSPYDYSAIDDILQKYNHFITINYNNYSMNDMKKFAEFTIKERNTVIDSGKVLKDYYSNTPLEFYDIVTKYEKDN